MHAMIQKAILTQEQKMDKVALSAQIPLDFLDLLSLVS
jgi:hypothetical protein